VVTRLCWLDQTSYLGKLLELKMLSVFRSIEVSVVDIEDTIRVIDITNGHTLLVMLKICW